MSDNCKRLVYWGQFGPTCWFNSLLMTIFYSQLSRELILKASKSWDSRIKIYKIFRHILKYKYIKSNNPEKDIKFFEDILKLSEELKFEVIWKHKRKKNLSRDNKYYWFVAEKYKKFSIESRYSANQIAQITNLSVCAPFTSAAFHENKSGRLESVFYDPINVILKDDRGAQGQKILNGYEELRSHLITEIKKNI